MTDPDVHADLAATRENRDELAAKLDAIWQALGLSGDDDPVAAIRRLRAEFDNERHQHQAMQNQRDALVRELGSVNAVLEVVRRNRDTFESVAQSNKRNHAVLAEVLDRVEKYADRLANYCSPHGVASRYAAELRTELSRPTEAERSGGIRPTPLTVPARPHAEVAEQHRRITDAFTADGSEPQQPVREPDGCPEPVWDGPYQFRCGLGASTGVCGRHGRFRDDKQKEQR